MASTRPEEKIEYLCDLSRDYYNLLERTVNGETESFIYDNNIISMSKAGSNYYYLQDELGSPMYMTGTGGVAVSSYAFDDFGRNIDPRTGKQRKHEYTTNGTSSSHLLSQAIRKMRSQVLSLHRRDSMMLQQVASSLRIM